MPGKIKVKILSGKNLPVMDRSSDTTDAYVEIKLGNTTYKTDVCRRTLHPQWNTDWYRFEVDDSELQDEPLQIRLMDHDTYSANDAIGKVYLNLNPLLLPITGQLVKYNGDGVVNHEISGWLPVYDTMHGIRGEVNVTVKVELFSDFNRFRQSSCGVHFFYSSTVPQGYTIKVIHGFVEELIVDDDPEYQWIDKIRTPRASNEARQTLFFKLSGELQRKIGVKALNLGGNSVIGYKQCFDLEGESGIVARGIGTAVTLVKAVNSLQPVIIDTLAEERCESYLKFVGGEKSFSLNSMPSEKQITTPLSLKLFDASITNPRLKQINKNLYSSIDTHLVRPSQSNPSLNETESLSLKGLLKQEDKRGVSNVGFTRQIKKFKYTQSSLSKKMSALKTKLGDSIGEEEGEKSASSKRKLFSRSRINSEASVMAEILARSIIHAQTSLSSILEDQDPSQDEEENFEGDHALSKAASKSNVSDDGTSYQQYFSSSETSSSSDSDEYEHRDFKKSADIETISNIITNVEHLQKCLSKEPLQKQYSLPALPISLFSLDYSKETSVDIKKEESDVTPEEELVGLKDSTPENTTNEDEASMEIKDVEEVVQKGEEMPLQQDPVEEYRDSIIPKEITEKVNISRKSLMQTAMQTMLLEKANIIGTYTAPSTPKLDIPVKASFCFDRVDKQVKKFPKSSSTASFSEYARRHETVLGVPFTAVSKLKSEYIKKQKSHPCLSKHFGVVENPQETEERNVDCSKFTSETRLDNASNMPHGIKRNFKLFGIKFKTGSHESGLNDSNRRFRLLSRKRRTSETEKETHIHKNLISRIFHKQDKEPTTTDKINKDEGTQTSTELINNPPVSSPDPVNLDTKTTKHESDLFQVVSIDTSDTTTSDTKNACITLNRHNTSPVPEPEPHTQGDASPETGIRMSPTKHNLHQRRSSDSDLSVTPKGNSLTGSDKSFGNTPGYYFRNNVIMRAQLNQENFDMLEYPFLTATQFPPGFIVQMGGSVSARSVKLLERISNVEEPESRDTWWSEIRMEIRSHARSLNCNAVLGYSESTSICDDICVLSASGTAAIIDFNCSEENEENIRNGMLFTKPCFPSKDIMSTSLEKDKNMNGSSLKLVQESPDHGTNFVSNCKITHLPYDQKSMPIKAKATICPVCLKGMVPEVVIATIEPPENLPNIGRGCFIESYVCRPLKDLRGEYIAKEISDGLPFLEYELHRLLVNKLKIKGMNSVFSLKIRITIGEKMLIGIATGTALYLSSLPSPVLPTLVSGRVSDEKKLVELQRLLEQTVKKNKELYQINIKDDNQNGKFVSDDDSEDEPNSLEFSIGNKDCCVLEVDDPEDAEVINLLIEGRVPDGFHVVNTESVPGLADFEIVKNLQMFTQIYRAKFLPPYNLHKHFSRLLQSVYFKLRRMVPCALCDLQFRVDLPESDELQLCVTGMALGLGKKQKKSKSVIPKRSDDDLIFKLDEDNPQENVAFPVIKSANSSLKYKQRSPSKYRPQSIKQRHIPHKERHGVDITPLSYVPGGKIEQYLGNINFFFIRETTSIREEGGLSGFIHSFVTEVLAIVRAHVNALGGNAMVAFFLTECILNHNLHKNQGQCLINVGGDVVFVSYFNEDA